MCDQNVMIGFFVQKKQVLFVIRKNWFVNKEET